MIITCFCFAFEFIICISIFIEFDGVGVRFFLANFSFM